MSSSSPSRRLFSLALLGLSTALAACQNMPTGYKYHYETYKAPPGPEPEARRFGELARGNDVPSTEVREIVVKESETATYIEPPLEQSLAPTPVIATDSGSAAIQTHGLQAQTLQAQGAPADITAYDAAADRMSDYPPAQSITRTTETTTVTSSTTARGHDAEAALAQAESEAKAAAAQARTAHNAVQDGVQLNWQSISNDMIGRFTAQYGYPSRPVKFVAADASASHGQTRKALETAARNKKWLVAGPGEGNPIVIRFNVAPSPDSPTTHAVMSFVIDEASPAIKFNGIYMMENVVTQ